MRIPSSVYPWLLLLPALSWIFLVFLYPMGFVFWSSFMGGGFGRLTEFVGFANYARMLTDDVLAIVLKNTFYLAFFSVGLRLLLALIIALALTYKGVRFSNLLLSLLLLPWALSGVVVSIFLEWMVDPSYGLLNYYLMSLGILREPINYMTSGTSAIWMIILAQVWSSVPYCAIILVAAIRSIPQDMYESAIVDGASALRRFRHITLPWLAPAFQFLLIIQTVFTLREFLYVYVLTMGGPAKSTQVFGTYLFQQIFQFGNFGYASAISVLMIIINIFIVAAYMILIKTEIR